MRRFLGLALVAILTLLAAFADVVRDDLWSRYRDDARPFVVNVSPDAATLAAPALTPRVILLNIPALRADTSRDMPALNKLRERGADYTLQLQPPLWRAPQLATLISGATPELHGITTNSPITKITADDIFRRLQIATASSPIRRDTIVIGSETWAQLVGNESRFEVATRDDDTLRRAREIINDQTSPFALLTIELSLIDTAAHSAIQQTSTATNTISVESAIATTDARLATWLDSLDLSNTTLVVFADYGAMRANTDAEEALAARVPLIMAGAGVRISRGVAQSTQLAPTLATLLGTSLPLHAQGSPIFNALQLPANRIASSYNASAEQRITLYESWSEVTGRPRFAAEIFQPYKSKLNSSDAAAVGRAFQSFEFDLDARFEAERQALAQSELWRRAPLLAGGLLCLISLGGMLVALFSWQSVLGMAVYWLLWWLSFAQVLHARYALGVFALGELDPMLAQYATYSALAWLGAAAVLMLLALRRTDAFDAMAFVISGSTLVALSQICVVWFVYLTQHDNSGFLLTDSATLATEIITLTQLSSLNWRAIASLPSVPLALVIAIISLMFFALFHRPPKRNEYWR